MNYFLYEINVYKLISHTNLRNIHKPGINVVWNLRIQTMKLINKTYMNLNEWADAHHCLKPETKVYIRSCSTLLFSGFIGQRSNTKRLPHTSSKTTGRIKDQNNRKSWIHMCKTLLYFLSSEMIRHCVMKWELALFQTCNLWVFFL